MPFSELENSQVLIGSLKIVVKMGKNSLLARGNLEVLGKGKETWIR